MTTSGYDPEFRSYLLYTQHPLSATQIYEAGVIRDQEKQF